MLQLINEIAKRFSNLGNYVFAVVLKYYWHGIKALS